MRIDMRVGVGIFVGLAALTICVRAGARGAQETQQKPSDLADASLEDLMKVEVTSVSNKEQKLSRTPAAAFVITQEDIRKSGALNVPDLLRMVPGMDVAQINAGTWAISSRGLNGQYSNELLVLIDGRNVYTASRLAASSGGHPGPAAGNHRPNRSMDPAGRARTHLGVRTP